MIKGHCVVRSDYYDGWPTVFAAVPRVDEQVENASGIEHRVVRVTHCERDSKPYIKVYLV